MSERPVELDNNLLNEYLEQEYFASKKNESYHSDSNEESKTMNKKDLKLAGKETNKKKKLTR